jgi:uncharacterized delta-60 repeat protein
VAIQPDHKVVVGGSAYTGANDDDFALARLNADGSPDLAFGQGGKRTTDFAGAYDHVQALSLTVEGKLLAVGRATGATDDFALVRYNGDGTLDPSFGTSGLQTSDFANGDDEASAVMLLPGGGFIAAGTAAMATDDFALARYDADGSLDLSFDGDGKAAVDLALGASTPFGLAVQPDGRILAAGEQRTGRTSGTALTVVRYLASGALDAAFGTGGVALVDFGLPAEARAVALDAEGKILVAGVVGVGAGSQFALARLHPSGALDAAFGAGGKVTTPFAVGAGVANAVAVQGDGKIVLAGAAGSGPSDFGLARYLSDGVLDPGFSGDGLVTVDINTAADAAWALAVQPDGRLLAAGYAYSGATSDFALVRLNTDGALDTHFDGDGKLMTDFAGANSYAYGVQVLAGGRIVAGGQVETNGGDFGLAAYNENGSADSSFDADGKVTTSIGAHDAGHALVVAADGKLLLAGRTQANDGRDDFALLRYASDGALDGTFSGDGMMTVDFAGAGASGFAAALQPDGDILLAGSAVNYALARVAGRPRLEVEIAADGQDVVLSWTMTAGAPACEVWRAPYPYYAPGDEGATLAVTIAPCSAGPVSWRDSDRVGDPAINHTYRVRTAGAAQGDATSGPSGEFDFGLVR